MTTPASASAHTKPRGRGAQATKFDFSETQKAVLKGYIPEFEQVVLDHDPSFEGRNSKVTKWKQNTMEEIMKSPHFLPLAKGGEESAKAWKEAVVRVYTNHFNGKMKLRRQRKSYATTTASQSSNTPPAALSRPQTTHSLIEFLGEITPREYFADQIEEHLVQEAQDELKDEFPTLRGGALWNKAVAHLWNNLDEEGKGAWKDRRDAAVGDIFGNQTDFPGLISTALDDICTRGRLGPVALSLSYGFRGEGGEVSAGTVYAGYDTVSKQVISTPINNHEDWLDKWLMHVDKVVPNHCSQAVNDICLNDDGIPLFPTDFDLQKSSPDQLRQALKDFYNALWVHLRSKVPRLKPAIQWEDIETKPSNYYDPRTTPFPLRNPTSTSIPNLYTIVEYFYKSALSNSPFCFCWLGLEDSSKSKRDDSKGNQPGLNTSKTTTAHLVATHSALITDGDSVTPPSPAVSPPSSSITHTSVPTTMSTTSLRPSAERTSLLVLDPPASSPLPPSFQSTPPPPPIPSILTSDLPTNRAPPSSTTDPARLCHAESTSAGVSITNTTLSLPKTDTPSPMQPIPTALPSNAASTTTPLWIGDEIPQLPAAVPLVDLASTNSVTNASKANNDAKSIPNGKKRKFKGGKASRGPTATTTILSPVTNATKMTIDTVSEESLESRRSSRKRKAPEPVSVLTSSENARATKKVKPSWSRELRACDDEGHPLDEHGNRLKF